MTAPKSYTGDTTPQNTDSLAGYRGPEGDDRPSQAFSDNTDPAANAAPPLSPPRAPEPEQRDPEDSPPLRSDPRQAIARRSRERRAEEHDRVVEELGDLNAPPSYAPLEGSQQDPAEDEPRPPTPPRPPVTDEPQTFTLKVNHNQFQVGHDDLVRYSGLDPADAAHLPQPALVMLAQKNLAADMRLQEVREKEQRLRYAAPEAPLHQGEDQRQFDQPSDQRTPAFDLKSAVQKIQLGDEDEAAQALVDTVSTLTQHQAAQQRAADRQREVQDGVRRDLERFATENPDITNDGELSAMHRSLLVQEAMSDVARIPGVPQERVAEAINNPALAMQIYQAAIMDGYAIRTPAEIFTTAANKIRAKMGMQSPAHADSQPDPRTMAKRGLIQQPARNDSGQQAARPQSPSRSSPSDTIRQMQGRTQGQRMAPRY